MALANAQIDGSGSTTVNQLLQAWINEYTRLHSGPRISYRPIGSNAGFRMLASGTAFFATTDVPVSDDQLAKANSRILQLPIVVNAVVPVYNLPQAPQLRFSGDTLAGIFLGKITKWNDAAITKDNPGVDLPTMDIKVKHDFPSASLSGTLDTYVMADYLSKVSPAFKTVLADSSGNWPVANNVYKGAEGTAGFVRHTPGAIGYVWQSRFHGTEQYGIVKNADGEFIAASPESLTAASASAMSSIKPLAPDFRVSITNAPGKASYPIASFTWLVLYENPKEKKQNEVMIDFLKWVLTDGQKVALKLGYPALPSDLVQMELQQLGTSAH